MTDPMWLLAFVYTPLTVVGLAGVGVFLHERALDREIAAEKAEAAREAGRAA